jgi:hypothetical protein
MPADHTTLTKDEGDPAMKIAYDVVIILYSLMIIMSVRLKLVRDPNAVEVIGGIHRVPLSMFGVLASLELAGAVGLLVGIEVKALGVAAAIGLVTYFVSATASHIRMRDFAPDHLGPALVMLTAAIAALALRLAA